MPDKCQYVKNLFSIINIKSTTLFANRRLASPCSAVPDFAPVPAFPSNHKPCLPSVLNHPPTASLDNQRSWGVERSGSSCSKDIPPGSDHIPKPMGCPATVPPPPHSEIPFFVKPPISTSFGVPHRSIPHMTMDMLRCRRRNEDIPLLVRVSVRIIPDP